MLPCFMFVRIVPVSVSDDNHLPVASLWLACGHWLCFLTLCLWVSSGTQM